MQMGELIYPEVFSESKAITWQMELISKVIAWQIQRIVKLRSPSAVIFLLP